MNRINSSLTSEDGRARRDACPMRGSSSSSLARTRLARIVCALPLFSLCIVLVAQPALAATWPVPTSGLSATLAFHQSYSAGIGSYVHSGIDIPASAGMQISSPLAGTVRFTGAVPSGDSRTGGMASAKTMRAVSIELGDGHVITLMPFASIDVREGQVVTEGMSLGTLAASGDVSTSATHLHMGYKRGSTYLDPMLLFGGAADAAHGSPVASTEAASPAVGVEASAPALTDAAGLVARESAPVPSAQSEPVAVPEGAPAPSVESFGAIETGDYELAQSESQVSSPLGFVMDGFSQLGVACAGQCAGLLEALSELSRLTGITLPALVAGTCVLAPCALLGLVLVCARRFMSQRRDTLKTQRSCLSLPCGGGSMQKLFPASGAAFMSRSRIAQRR